MEDEESLARRAASGVAVSVRVEHDGPSTDVHLALRLPGGRVISAEVDAGSDQLILNQALAAEAGVDLAGQAVRKVEGRTRPATRSRATSPPCGAISAWPPPRRSARPIPT